MSQDKLGNAFSDVFIGGRDDCFVLCRDKGNHCILERCDCDCIRRALFDSNGTEIHLHEAKAQYDVNDKDVCTSKCWKRRLRFNSPSKTLVFSRTQSFLLGVAPAAWSSVCCQKSPATGLSSTWPDAWESVAWTSAAACLSTSVNVVCAASYEKKSKHCAGQNDSASTSGSRIASTVFFVLLITTGCK